MTSAAKRARRAKQKSKKAARAHLRRAVIVEFYSEDEYFEMFAALAAVSDSHGGATQRARLSAVFDPMGLGIIRYKPSTSRERSECIAAIRRVHADFCVCGDPACRRVASVRESDERGETP